MTILGLPLEKFAAFTLPLAVLTAGAVYLVANGWSFPRAARMAVAGVVLLAAGRVIGLASDPWQIIQWASDVTGQSVLDVLVAYNSTFTACEIAGLLLLSWAVGADRRPTGDDDG